MRCTGRSKISSSAAASCQYLSARPFVWPGANRTTRSMLLRPGPQESVAAEPKTARLVTPYFLQRACIALLFISSASVSALFTDPPVQSGQYLKQWYCFVHHCGGNGTVTPWQGLPLPLQYPPSDAPAAPTSHRREASAVDRTTPMPTVQVSSFARPLGEPHARPALQSICSGSSPPPPTPLRLHDAGLAEGATATCP
jgi:hypothetical protein